MAALRRQVFFAGRVQGVGFRMTTVSIAKQFAVTGMVKNLADGRVEAIIEGDSGEIEQFLSALRRRMSGFIKNEQIVDDLPTGEFDGFEVRR